MTVYDLNRDQLTELKQNYYTQLLDERGESPSYEELAFIDDYVSDEEIYDEYAGTDFVPDDFSCSAGDDEEECEKFQLDLNCYGDRATIASELRSIATAIEYGNYGGIAPYGTTWGLDKE